MENGTFSKNVKSFSTPKVCFTFLFVVGDEGNIYPIIFTVRMFLRMYVIRNAYF